MLIALQRLTARCLASRSCSRTFARPHSPSASLHIACSSLQAGNLTVDDLEVKLSAQAQDRPHKRRKLDLKPFACPCCTQQCLRPARLIAHLQACCPDLFSQQVDPASQHKQASQLSNFDYTIKCRSGISYHTMTRRPCESGSAPCRPRRTSTAARQYVEGALAARRRAAVSC